MESDVRCKECLYWQPLTKSPISWGTCLFKVDVENLKQQVPFFVKIDITYGSVSPDHGWDCNVLERKKDARDPKETSV